MGPPSAAEITGSSPAAAAVVIVLALRRLGWHTASSESGTTRVVLIPPDQGTTRVSAGGTLIRHPAPCHCAGAGGDSAAPRAQPSTNFSLGGEAGPEIRSSSLIIKSRAPVSGPSLWAEPAVTSTPIAAARSISTPVSESHARAWARHP